MTNQLHTSFRPGVHATGILFATETMVEGLVLQHLEEGLTSLARLNEYEHLEYQVVLTDTLEYEEPVPEGSGHARHAELRRQVLPLLGEQLVGAAAFQLPRGGPFIITFVNVNGANLVSLNRFLTLQWADIEIVDDHDPRLGRHLKEVLELRSSFEKSVR